MRKKAVASRILVPAAFFAYFLVYFGSEAFLRQAAVARISPNDVELNKIISQLPADTQDAINYRINITYMRNAVSEAKNTSDKVQAMCAIAMFTRDDGERLKIYETILANYPDTPQSYPAYIHYIFNDDPALDKVPLKRFHSYLASLEQAERYNAWVAAYNKLIMRKKKVTSDELFLFLRPLVNDVPQYRDYSILLRELAKSARRIERPDIAGKAENLYEECRYLPGIFEYFVQMEQYK